MTSVSMALNALGVSVGGGPVNPGAMNAYLVANNGYVCAGGDCNNLVLNVVDSITGKNVTFVSEDPKPDIAEIQNGLEMASTIYVAHVHNRTHFVLLTGWNAAESNFFVNDPFYNSTTYEYDDIADIIIYKINNRGSPVIPTQYPLYKQCDPRWGNDTMVTTTVCDVGCLMSSISMAIGENNILIAGQTSNPGTLNAWLRTNNGYNQDNDLEEDVVPNINPSHISWPSDGMHTSNDIPYSGIAAYLKAGRPVIANVMDGGHFVLVVGYDAEDGDTLYINDPGFSISTYSYSRDVVGWRLFTMTPVSSAPRLRGSITQA